MGPTPAATAPRRFTMADLMILVAGSAIGIAWTKFFHEEMTAMWLSVRVPWGIQFAYLIHLSMPILAWIGVALMACRLRSPRPPLRLLSRQFGTLALACTTLVVAAELTSMLAGWASKFVLDRLSLSSFGTPVLYSSYLVTTTYQLDKIGTGIVACWLLLFVLGRRRAEKTWIDRMGRALGACWIALHFLLGIVNYAHL